MGGRNSSCSTVSLKSSFIYYSETKSEFSGGIDPIVWIHITKQDLVDWLTRFRRGNPTTAGCMLERLRTWELLSPQDWMPQ